MKRVLLTLAALLLLGGMASAQKTSYLSFGAEYDLGRTLGIIASQDTPLLDLPSIGRVGPVLQLRGQTDLTDLTLTAYLGMQLVVNPRNTPWLVQFQVIEKPVWTLGSAPEFRTAVSMQFVHELPGLSIP